MTTWVLGNRHRNLYGTTLRTDWDIPDYSVVLIYNSEGNLVTSGIQKTHELPSVSVNHFQELCSTIEAVESVGKENRLDDFVSFLSDIKDFFMTECKLTNEYGVGSGKLTQFASALIEGAMRAFKNKSCKPWEKIALGKLKRIFPYRKRFDFQYFDFLSDRQTGFISFDSDVWSDPSFFKILPKSYEPENVYIRHLVTCGYGPLPPFLGIIWYNESDPSEEKVESPIREMILGHWPIRIDLAKVRKTLTLPEMDWKEFELCPFQALMNNRSLQIYVNEKFELDLSIELLEENLSLLKILKEQESFLYDDPGPVDTEPSKINDIKVKPSIIERLEEFLADKVYVDRNIKHVLNGTMSIHHFKKVHASMIEKVELTNCDSFYDKRLIGALLKLPLWKQIIFKSFFLRCSKEQYESCLEYFLTYVSYGVFSLA